MIKFFRKIRYNLMSENKTGKYLKYAIGEIILVMIGILLALQVNNWNQKRMEVNEEKIILSNLKEDFESAIVEFKSLNSLREDVIYAAKAIYEVDIKDIENYHSRYLDSLLLKTLTAPTFNNQAGSLNVLLTSGKINLIANQPLKKKLIEWPGDVADMTEDEINHSNLYVDKYCNILDKYISWNTVFKHGTNGGSRFKERLIKKMEDNAMVSSDYKLLLEDKVFLNTLRRRAIYCELTNGETTILIEKAENIITSINKELNN